MKSKNKIGPFFLKLVAFTLGLGLGVLCLMMIKAMANEFVIAGLIGCIVIGFISVTLIHLGINQLKSLTVDLQNKTVTIRYLGLFVSYFTIDKLRGYNRWPFSNKFGKYQGTLIELKDGRQIHITEFDTSNYFALRNALTSFISRDIDIRLKFWTTFNRSSIIFGIIMIVFMLTIKILE